MTAGTTDHDFVFRDRINVSLVSLIYTLYVVNNRLQTLSRIDDVKVSVLLRDSAASGTGVLAYSETLAYAKRVESTHPKPLKRCRGSKKYSRNKCVEQCL